MADQDQGITGRDGYIMAHALHLAIKWIDAMPEEHRALSDQQDMRAILKARFPNQAELFVFQDDLKRALRHGFVVEPGEPISADDLRDFLASLPDKARCARGREGGDAQWAPRMSIADRLPRQCRDHEQDKPYYLNRYSKALSLRRKIFECLPL